MAKYIQMVSLNVNAPDNNGMILEYGVPALDSNYYVGSKNSSDKTYALYGFQVGNQFYYAFDNTGLSSGYYGVVYYSALDSDPNSRANDFLYVRGNYNYKGLNIKIGSFDITGNSKQIPAGLNGSYNSLEEACSDIFTSNYLKIVYNGGAVSIAGAKIVQSGTEVNAFIGVPQGIEVTQADISIIKISTGAIIPFTFENNKITFTAV